MTVKRPRRREEGEHWSTRYLRQKRMIRHCWDQKTVLSRRMMRARN